MKKAMIFALALFAVAATAAEVLKWNAENSFSGWRNPAGMTMSIENGVLVLDVTKPDSGMMNLQVNLPPEAMGALEVVYRATGFPARNHGEFYFAGDSNSWSEKRVWRHYSLKMDGQWQILRVDGNRFDRSGIAECGRITKLRLDMINQCPGKIEIKEIRLLPVEKAYVWNASNDFFGWQYPSKMKLSKKDGLLILDITGHDSSIRNNSVQIPTDKYDAIEIDYRAEGLPAVNNGEIYYAGEGKYDSFTQSRAWTFQNIPGNTDWHTLRVTPGGKGGQAWLDTKLMTKIRLDLFNQFPGKVEIREIRIMPKLPALADSPAERRKWHFPTVKYEIPPIKLQKVDMGRPYYSCYMTSCDKDIAHKLPPIKGARFAFKHEFTLKAIPVAAKIHIGADDAYTSKLNGRHLSGHGSWYNPDISNVDVNRFVLGKNELTGIYHNGGGPGGVYFELEMLMPDNTIQKVCSGKTTVFTPTGKDDWTYPPANAVYTPGIEHNMPPVGEWGARELPFKPLLPKGLKLVSSEISGNVESGKTYDWHVRVNGVNAQADELIIVRLESLAGRRIGGGKYKVADVKQADGSWKVPVTFPKFISSGKMNLRLTSSTIIMPEIKTSVSYKNIRKKGTPYRARVRNGEIYLNGKRTLPVIGHTAGKRLYNQDGFDRAGVELRAVGVETGSVNDFWLGPDKYDFSVNDSRVNDILARDENVGLIFYVDTTPGSWWAKLYPGEMARRNDGTIMSDHQAKVSFASEQYRIDGMKALAAFADHVQKSPYSDKVAGFVIRGGTTAEWLQWDPFDKIRFSDYSEPIKRRFAEYVQKHAPEMEAKLPTVADRKKYEFGYFINPETNRHTLLYNRFMSEMIAECIEHLAKGLRAKIGEEQLIGIYYGYTFAAANQGRIIHGSHGAIRKVLDIKELDFFLCPMAYSVRNVGDCGEDGTPFASIRAAGKMPVVEDDIRTHADGIPRPYYQTPNAWLTDQVIRRSMGRNLTRLQMAEHFAITTSKEFSAPQTIEDTRTFRKALKFAVDNNAKSQPEIAVVVSAGAYDYVANYVGHSLIWGWEYVNGTGKPQFVPHVNSYVTGDLIAFQRTNLAKIGAPVDYLCAENLDQVVDRPYKLWIFLSLFESTPQIEAAMKKIQSKGNICLFMYAPGVFRNDKIDIANMEKLTGIKLQRKSGAGTARVTFPEQKNAFTNSLRYYGMGADYNLPLLFEALSGEALAVYPDGKVGVATAMKGKSRSVFCGVPKLSSDFMRSLAKAAGVWIFSETDDVLFANDMFVTLHATQGGEKVIKFPRKVNVVNVFTGKLEAENVSEYRYTSQTHETRVIYYGDRKKLY